MYARLAFDNSYNWINVHVMLPSKHRGAFIIYVSPIHKTGGVLRKIRRKLGGLNKSGRGVKIEMVGGIESCRRATFWENCKGSTI